MVKGEVGGMTQQEICRKAVEKFGQLQVIKAIEEMSELQKELCKLLLGDADHEHIAEEIADVEIMLEQLKVMFANKLDVAGWKIGKLRRLEELLEVQE